MSMSVDGIDEGDIVDEIAQAELLLGRINEQWMEMGQLVVNAVLLGDADTSVAQDHCIKSRHILLGNEMIEGRGVLYDGSGPAASVTEVLNWAGTHPTPHRLTCLATSHLPGTVRLSVTAWWGAIDPSGIVVPPITGYVLRGNSLLECTGLRFVVEVTEPSYDDAGPDPTLINNAHFSLITLFPVP